MNKSILVVCLLIVISVFSGCGGSTNTTVPTPAATPMPSPTPEIKLDGRIKQIETTYNLKQIEDGKQKVVVWVKNNSECIFDGTLYIKAFDPSNIYLGGDSMWVEKLIPGNSTYANVWAKPSSTMRIEFEWKKDYEFKEYEANKKDTIELNSVDKTINYSVKHVLKSVRFDGGNKIYVLIDPINISNDHFKLQTQNIIKILVNEYGIKTSVVFYDEQNALDTNYKYTEDMSLKSKNDKQLSLIERHFVAWFSGDLSTGTYRNTLDYFPAAFSDSKDIGKYRTTIEFNP